MFKMHMKPLLILATLLFGLACPAALPSQVSDLPSLAPMLERATQGVVNISIYTSVRFRSPLHDFSAFPMNAVNCGGNRAPVPG